MNILLFLTPKKDVTLLYDDFTIGQALRVIELGGHHAVPVIRRSGEYVGTITEGDLLWYLQRSGLSFADVEKLPLTLVPHSRDNKPLLASMDLTHLLENSMVQNFARWKTPWCRTLHPWWMTEACSSASSPVNGYSATCARK